MSDWNVVVEAWAPSADWGGRRPDDSSIQALIDALGPEQALVVHDDNVWSAWVTVEADRALDAVSVAVDRVETAVHVVDFPPWPIERVEATKYVVDDGDSPFSDPQRDLIGVVELSKLLGVNVQRTQELLAAGRIPPPDTAVMIEPQWSRSAMEEFTRDCRESSGRP